MAYTSADAAVRKRKSVAPNTIPNESDPSIADQTQKPQLPELDANKIATPPASANGGGYNAASTANAGANGKVTSPEALLPRVAESAAVSRHSAALSAPQAPAAASSPYIGYGAPPAPAAEPSSRQGDLSMILDDANVPAEEKQKVVQILNSGDPAAAAAYMKQYQDWKLGQTVVSRSGASRAVLGMPKPAADPRTLTPAALEEARRSGKMTPEQWNLIFGKDTPYSSYRPGTGDNMSDQGYYSNVDDQGVVIDPNRQIQRPASGGVPLHFEGPGGAAVPTPQPSGSLPGPETQPSTTDSIKIDGNWYHMDKLPPGFVLPPGTKPGTEFTTPPGSGQVYPGAPNTGLPPPVAGDTPIPKDPSVGGPPAVTPAADRERILASVDQNSSSEIQLIKQELSQVREQLRQQAAGSLAKRGVGSGSGVAGRYYREIDKNVAEQLAQRVQSVQIEANRQKLAYESQLKDQAFKEGELEIARAKSYQDYVNSRPKPLNFSTLLGGVAQAALPAAAQGFLAQTGIFAPPATVPLQQKLGGLDPYYNTDSILRRQSGYGGGGMF